MKQTRREFLRGALAWGGCLLAGTLELEAVRHAEPLRRARRYLAAQQSADGAWRSGRYAAFREGDVLTPVVLWAMATPASAAEVPGRGGVPPAVFGVPPNTSGSDPASQPASPSAWLGQNTQFDSRDISPAAESFARGLQWLCDLTDALRDRDDPWSDLRYPLFTASYSAQVLARCGDLDRAAAWVRIIRALRTSSELGWSPQDPMCGAWSDASKPPRFVAPVPDMLAPNISATALAVGALAAAGCAGLGMTAQPFIERCQNFAEAQPAEFDDGGFFFALDDPIRNKAGSAGHDPDGHARFHSYGSATCDGWLALRACGLPREHPRLRAATAWLRDHGDGLTPGGDWPVSRAEARASLAYYQAQALATVLADLGPEHGWSQNLRKSLDGALLAKQSRDGSWQGLAPDSCEDEPLLATAFATRALG